MAAQTILSDVDMATPIVEQYPYFGAGDTHLGHLTSSAYSSPSITPQNSTDMELETSEISVTLPKKIERSDTAPAPRTSPPTPTEGPWGMKKGKSVPISKQETARIVEMYLKRRSISMSSADMAEDHRRVQRKKKNGKRNNTISISSNISTESNEQFFLPRASDSFSKELSKVDYNIENLNVTQKKTDMNREKSYSAPSTLRYKAKPCERDFVKIEKMKAEGLLEPYDDSQIHERKGKKKIKRRKTIIARAKSFISSPTSLRKSMKDGKEVDIEEKENLSKVHSEMKKTGFGKRLRKMFGIDSRKQKQGSRESSSSSHGANRYPQSRSSSASPSTPGQEERKKTRFPSFLWKKARKGSPIIDEEPGWHTTLSQSLPPQDGHHSATNGDSIGGQSYVVRYQSQPNHLMATMQGLSRPTSLGLNLSSLSNPSQGFNDVLHINSPLQPGIGLRATRQSVSSQAPLANFEDDLQLDGLSDDEILDNGASADSMSIGVASSSAASEDDLDRKYRDVAERLAEIGDVIQFGAVGGQGAAAAANETDTCAASNITEQIGQRMLEDITNFPVDVISQFPSETVMSVVINNTYSAFSNTMEHLVGQNQGWDQVALVLKFTKVAMQTARSIGRHATQIKDNSIEYISDHFTEWVGSQGGWESIIICDSDENDESEID